ncbi:MAG: tetratricopeptide repeat protein [Phycisphaerales bacterium]|nr:tetratricopeptide repeat protein [Phycisphaerales bacterium]
MRALSVARAQPPTIEEFAQPKLGAPGTLFREKYRILSILGRNAHALTLLASHEFVNYSCVVKLLDRHAAPADTCPTKNFRDEISAGLRVRHPNVVRVLEYDIVGQPPYFVMEYVEGLDLGRALDEAGPFDWRQVLDIGVAIADALAAIHEAGLIHRDIKPANILLGVDGHIRIADLGIAAAAGNSRAPGIGLTGTVHYAAPEIFDENTEIDARADIYSLGATLFHLLTGAPLGGAQAGLGRLFGAEPTPDWPATVQQSAPTWLRNAIEHMTCAAARGRPADMPAVLQMLRRTHNRVSPRRVDSLAPHGVVVLPFISAGGETSENEWLGFALADALARRISETPGTFVANTEQFQQQLARRDGARESRAEQLLKAGRIAGADRIVEGVFEQSADSITIRASLLAAGELASRLVAAVAGPLDAINDLQHALYLGVAGSLQLAPQREPASGAQPRTVALAAQEKATLGRQAYLRGEYAKAIRLAEQAFELDPQVVEPLSYIGACHARLGNYEESETYHRQLESIALERSEKRLLVESHANLGVMHYFRGDYETSVRLQLSAARIAEELSMTAELAFISNNLGFAQFRLERGQEAEVAFRTAIEIHRRFGALGALIAPYNGLGNVLVEEGRFSEAREFYAEALALAEEIGDRTNVGLTHLHLGRAATLEARYAEAKHELAIALSVFEDATFWNGLMRAHEYMVDLNTRLGDFAEALRGVEKRIALAGKFGNARLEAAALRQKSEVHRASGNMELAEKIAIQANDCERVLAAQSQ